jgi:hypothetical protein
MAKSSRWLAVRYAMVRWAEKCRTVRMGNCSDIMTKCLVGPAFIRHRATILGTGWPGSKDAEPEEAAAGELAE